MISRIQTRQIFQRLQKDGTYVRSGSLWCSMIIDKSLPQPSVAYALSRQVGGAVERNLLKRRLREIFRVKSTKTELFQPGWYLIGGFSGVTRLSYADLSHNVDRLLERCALKTEKIVK